MGGPPGDRCGYVWTGSSTDAADGGYESCCYRETVAGSNRCRWHASDVVGGRLQTGSPSTVSAATSPYRELLDGSKCTGVDFGEGADLHGVALRGADLSGTTLVGADLSGATLRGADLRGSDLRKARIVGVDLQSADLRDANLTDAELRDVDARGATFDGATCQGARFEDVYLHEASMQSADFSGAMLRETYARDAALQEATLTRCTCEGVQLMNVDASRVELRGAELKDIDAQDSVFVEAEMQEAVLKETKFTGSDLRNASLGYVEGDALTATNAVFHDASLENADLGDSDLARADFTGATLWDAALFDAELAWVNLSDADCRGADFTEANLTHARLEGADLRNAVLKQTRLYEATFENARLNVKTMFAATVGDDPSSAESDDADALERAEWAHWKVHSLLSDHGLYRQATEQKHHLTEALLKTRRAALAFHSADGLRLKLRTGSRYLRYRSTTFGIRLGEYPSFLGVFAIVTVLLGAVAYPVFGIQHGGVVYKYGLEMPSLTAIAITLGVSLEQVVIGVLKPFQWFLGAPRVDERVAGLVAAGAVPVGAGGILQLAQQAIGGLLTMLAGVVGLQRLILYTRKRTGAETYGGILSWLLGR